MQDVVEDKFAQVGHDHMISDLWIVHPEKLQYFGDGKLWIRLGI